MKVGGSSPAHRSRDSHCRENCECPPICTPSQGCPPTAVHQQTGPRVAPGETGTEVGHLQTGSRESTSRQSLLNKQALPQQWKQSVDSLFGLTLHLKSHLKKGEAESMRMNEEGISLETTERKHDQTCPPGGRKTCSLTQPYRGCFVFRSNSCCHCRPPGWKNRADGTFCPED